MPVACCLTFAERSQQVDTLNADPISGNYSYAAYLEVFAHPTLNAVSTRRATAAMVRLTSLLLLIRFGRRLVHTDRRPHSGNHCYAMCWAIFIV